MHLPADMRARVLRSTLDCAVTALRSGDDAIERAHALLNDARRHAHELETALSLAPAPTPSTPPTRPGRRFVGHAVAGSNVITLRAS